VATARGERALSEGQEPGEARPAADLLPVVYDELRRLAAALERTDNLLWRLKRQWHRWFP
jgi:hypothetical protein